MKKIEHVEKYIYSLLLLGGLFTFSGLSMKNSLPILKERADETIQKLQELGQEEKEVDEGEKEDEESTIGGDTISEVLGSSFLQVDSDISENVFARYQLIEDYGTVNRLIGKHEINGYSYAIDKNGAYNSVNFWNEVQKHETQRYAQQLFLLQQDVEENGGNLIFLAFPNKYYEKWNEGYAGIPYNGYNSKVDDLLLWNRRYGVDSIDCRQTLAESGLAFDEMFYQTDHHWTGYAAFLVYQDLVEHMNEKYDANLDSDYYYTDINNYDVEWHEGIFLGASGRNVGLSFSGRDTLEDFQTVTPKFSANIKWMGREGDYTDTVLETQKLEYEDVYQSDMYGFYLGGVMKNERIVNEDNPDGLKIFFIRDSFASPIMIDMIPYCSQIDGVWGKYATDEYVKEMVAEGDYDYVIVGYYPEDITENFFQFYAEDQYEGEEE
ncbi:MAG: DHHW family protein [Roseburia sp.]